MPINPDNADKFDPVDGVPTVSQLLTELDQSDLTMSSDMQASGAMSMPARSVLCAHSVMGTMQSCFCFAESVEVHKPAEGSGGFPHLLSQ